MESMSCTPLKGYINVSLSIKRATFPREVRDRTDCVQSNPMHRAINGAAEVITLTRGSAHGCVGVSPGIIAVD